MISTGVDIEDISRFNNKTIEKDEIFLNRIFSKKELDYCFKNNNPAPRLAARFCAKEATIKAIGNINNTFITYKDIEILKKENGSVYINVLKEEFKKYNFSLSISHEKDKAIAFVVMEY